jgi:hypothetical protein
MSLQQRYKPERKHKISYIIPYRKTASVVPVANDNNKSIDINQISLSFDPDRKITLKSLGNYLRHTRGSQIHNGNVNSSRRHGGKITKNTKKYKPRKNRTKRRKYKLVNKTLKKN